MALRGWGMRDRNDEGENIVGTAITFVLHNS